MADRCLLCGAKNATCGVPTHVTPVDARITGVRVAGDTLVPDISAAMPTDLTDEEREEFLVLNEAYERRRNRLKVRQAAMADGTAAHTSLSYVRCPDGITRKMQPDTARRYVEMNPDAEITREGALPVAKEGEVIGATKATVGEMFDDNGRQLEDVQPMTTRTFLASDRTRNEAVTPSVGTVGAASTDVNTGTGSQTSSAVTSSAPSKPTATVPSGRSTGAGARASADADKDKD